MSQSSEKSIFKQFCAGLLVALAFFVLAYLVVMRTSAAEFIGTIFGRTNLIQYIILCCAFIVGFTVGASLLSKHVIQDKAISKSKYWMIVAVVFVFNALVLALVFRSEKYSLASEASAYWYHNIPLIAAVLLGLIVCVAVIALLYKTGLLQREKCRVGTIIFFIVALVLGMMSAWNYWNEDIFYNYSTTYHYDAVFNSIISVCQGVPYDNSDTSIYGHYALILVPVIKFLSMTLGMNELPAFQVCLVIIALLTVAAYAFALHVIVKNDTIRIIALIAGLFPVLIMRTQSYLQVWPLRTFSIALLMGIVALYVVCKRRRMIIVCIGYVLSCLTIVWNTETGLFFALSWSLIMLLSDIEKKRNIALFAILRILACIAAFACAIGLTSLYNLEVGGQAISFFCFILPLGNNSYMTGSLQEPLQKTPAVWQITTLVFLAVFCMSLWQWATTMKKNANETNRRYLLALVAISAMALLSYMYVINRPAYSNFDICMMPVALLIAYLCSLGLSSIGGLTRYQALKSSVSFATLCPLILLTCLTIVMLPGEYMERIALHENNSFNSAVDTVAESVPEDTQAFGAGALEIYAALGRQNIVTSFDLADITNTVEAKELFKQRMYELERQSVLMNEAILVDCVPPEMRDSYEYFLSTHNACPIWEGNESLMVLYTPKN